jgi:hypothetical protein
MSTDHTSPKSETEAELRAAVGTNADYFLAKWKGSKRAGLNLAAFGIPVFWLPYRKMHSATAILFGLLLLESITERLARNSEVMQPETPRRIQVLLTIVTCWVCGAYGSGWYRSHVTRLIASARRREPNTNERLKLLAASGGTSLRVVGLWLLAFVVASIAITYMLERVLVFPT